MVTRQFAGQPPGSAQVCAVGSGVVKVGSSYDNNTGSLPAPPPNHGSLKITLTLGVAAAIAELAALPQFHPVSASAIVSPLPSAFRQVVYAPCVPGNGPVDVAPVHAEANSAARPWEKKLPPATGVCCAGGRWQPLHWSTSPGSSCSQARCSGKMRRALASTTETWMATFAGTVTRTEPSGSIGT